MLRSWKEAGRIMTQLIEEEKKTLLKFLCVLAWADFNVHPAERLFIENLCRDLDISESLKIKVQAWLQHPPKPEEVDPYSIPQELIELVLDKSGSLACADGVIDIRELEMIELLHTLVDTPL